MARTLISSSHFFICFMKRNVNNSIINKEFILSKISQISIFSAYTNLDPSIIQDCIENNTMISSPFRIDNHPSFGFRYDNRNKLKARDFAGYFWGDCFDAAAYVLSAAYNKEININNKKDFQYVLKHIANTFRHIIYGNEKDENINNEVSIGLENIKNKKNIIEFVIREWNQKDINYWKQFDIDINLLNTSFVYPIEQYYINRNINPEPKYYYNTKDVCYAYILGKDKYGIYNVKLYFPNRKKGEVRFITNCNHIEGVLNFNTYYKYDYIIVTKSTKDRLALKSYLYKSNILSFYGGINVGLINIPCESYHLKQKEYDYLLNNINNHNNIISLMDNDLAGKKEAIYLRDNFNITPVLIPKEYNSKDFAELRQNCSIDTINQLFNKVTNYIFNKNENTEFTWDKTENNTLPF